MEGIWDARGLFRLVQAVSIHLWRRGYVGLSGYPRRPTGHSESKSTTFFEYALLCLCKVLHTGLCGMFQIAYWELSLFRLCACSLFFRKARAGKLIYSFCYTSRFQSIQAQHFPVLCLYHTASEMWLVSAIRRILSMAYLIRPKAVLMLTPVQSEISLKLRF